MRTRTLLRLLFQAASLGGAIAILIDAFERRPSALVSLLTLAYGLWLMICVGWELRQRRQGSRIARGIANGWLWWGRDRAVPPSPQRFLLTSLALLWLAPLAIGLSAAGHLGGWWFLVPLSCATLVTIALLANFRAERSLRHAL